MRREKAVQDWAEVSGDTFSGYLPAGRGEGEEKLWRELSCYSSSTVSHLSIPLHRPPLWIPCPLLSVLSNMTAVKLKLGPSLSIILTLGDPVP